MSNRVLFLSQGLIDETLNFCGTFTFIMSSLNLEELPIQSELIGPPVFLQLCRECPHVGALFLYVSSTSLVSRASPLCGFVLR